MTSPTGAAPATLQDPHVRLAPSGVPILPGGYGRSAYHVGQTPPYAVSGEGCMMRDDTGRELIDANGNFTTLVHGNAHPQIVEAAEREIRRGASWGVPNGIEWEFAEAMMRRLPWLDQIRFTNSGTEALMSAFRIARAFTGRDDIIMTKDGFHGTSDTALMTGGPTRGVPTSVADHIALVPLGDVEALRALFEAGPNRFAAIVLDLIPNKAGLIRLSDEFVAEARRLATEHGALLIIDEVISFRLGAHGFSGVYGVKPDLLATGKVIGGGFPVGAIAGTSEVMSVLDPWVPGAIQHSGTFSGNPVTAAAGVAALELLTPEEIERINGLGDFARAQLQVAIAPFGWEARGWGSLVRAFPANARSVDSTLQQRLWWAVFKRGAVLSSANLAALSTPMNGAVVSQLVEILAAAVQAVVEDGE